MRALARLAVVASLLSACAANTASPAGGAIEVRGRVVDAESCASAAGCTGVAGAVVSLHADPDHVRSEPSGPEGAFVLRGVPTGYHQHLLVSVPGVGFAPTLNPMVVAPDDRADLFGVTIYVMPRDASSLLEALRAEGIDLVLGGGYVGQVLRVNGSTVTAADGAHAEVHPAQRSLRYVGVLPRFVPGDPVLLPADATATGAFGMFVVEAAGPADPVAFTASDEEIEYDLVVAPLEPGLLIYSIHRGSL